MAFQQYLVFLLALVVGFNECAFVDNLKQCKLKDHECAKNEVQKLIKLIPKNGVPELGIPGIDPVALKNLKIQILNALNLTLHEGTAKGIKNCVVNKFEINIEKEHAYLDITCDLVIKGKYTVVSQGDNLKNILGGNIEGEGIGKFKIDKINIKIDFPTVLEKRGEDIFLNGDIKKYKHTYRILGRFTIAADNLRLGGKDASKELTKLLNDNWQLMVASFGNDFVDFAMKSVLYKYLHKIYNSIPTKYYIQDDLTPYL